MSKYLRHPTVVMAGIALTAMLQVNRTREATAAAFESDPTSYTESFFFTGSDPYDGGFSAQSGISVPVSGYAEAELGFLNPSLITVDIEASQFEMLGVHSWTVTTGIGDVDIVFEDVGFSIELSALFVANTGPGFSAIHFPGSPPPSVIVNKGTLSLVNATGIYEPAVGDGFTLDFEQTPQAAVGFYVSNNSDAGTSEGIEYFRLGDLWIYIEVLPYNEEFIYAGITPNISLQAVPEPSTLALGFSCCLVFGFCIIGRSLSRSLRDNSAA